MIEIALTTGQSFSEVEALGPHGWATIVEILNEQARKST